MCQWKFLVFRYSPKTSASKAFRAPEISCTACRSISDGVANGAVRRAAASDSLDILIPFWFHPYDANGSRSASTENRKQAREWMPVRSRRYLIVLLGLCSWASEDAVTPQMIHSGP